MIKVNGIELDFDITSPADVMRYKQAGEKMESEGANIQFPALEPDNPAFLNAYIDMLNADLRLYGSFLEEVFGDGIATRLLGKKPSLNKVAEVNEAMGLAIEEQGKEFGVRIQKYKPNRAARRAK